MRLAERFVESSEERHALRRRLRIEGGTKTPAGIGDGGLEGTVKGNGCTPLSGPCHCESSAERVILATIERHKQNSETFNKAFNSSFSREEDQPPESPGLWSSASIDSDGGTERKSSSRKKEQTCKGCSESFHSITKRRHHCKSCGAVRAGPGRAGAGPSNLWEMLGDQDFGEQDEPRVPGVLRWAGEPGSRGAGGRGGAEEESVGGGETAWLLPDLEGGGEVGGGRSRGGVCSQQLSPLSGAWHRKVLSVPVSGEHHNSVCHPKLKELRKAPKGALPLLASASASAWPRPACWKDPGIQKTRPETCQCERALEREPVSPQGAPLASPPFSHGVEGQIRKRDISSKQNSLGVENCLFCSPLHIQEKGRSWTKVWVAVTKAEPLVLYLQTSGQEARGARAIPLPGYEVSVPGEKQDMKHVIRLSHCQQTILLSAHDSDLQAKWVEIFNKASKGEAPTETPVCPAEFRKSQ
ncbi:hypothetical protein JZ751_014519 [Albula glossodonta]|uniref:PH domain-containing protein n=1 Tax=Albula glossodonta TaxID=121402 RepID=A0A8T2N1Y1_9TELE|nr:hypothetical protein JZ751_014519 [Albula glossodonta]